jgi:hypothetical protein
MCINMFCCLVEDCSRQLRYGRYHTLLCFLYCLFVLQEEPGELDEAVGNTTQASYRLLISRLVPGTTYTTYRLSGLLTGVLIMAMHIQGQ